MQKIQKILHTGLQRYEKNRFFVASAAHGENLDATLHKPLDHGTVYLGIHERACRVASVGERQRRRRQTSLKILDIVPPVVQPVERLLVIRLGVEKRYLLHS